VVARYYARRTEALLRPARRKGALPLLTKTLEYRHPVGVVGFLSPWNYPLTLAITDALAALMAGNAGVLKPDSQASFTALWAVALLRECGLPPDVLAVVTGDGARVGTALTGLVDYVMFTGSGETGRAVGRRAAERLVGCSLELGGKNPMLVLEDARLADAVEGAIRGCFCGAGQVCVSVERIYTHERVFDEFLSRFVERARGMKMGAALDYSVEMGSLTTERQVARVEAHVADAVAKGAAVAAGGKRRPDLGPLFYEPTILTGVREGMLAFEEETFGPVVAVYRVSNDEDAVERANATRYGLNAGIWSRDTRRAMRLAQRIHAGSVNINEAYAAAWGSVDSPLGGMKESGLQPRHGAEGILKYTASQTVAVQRLIPIAPFGPVDAARYARWMTRLLRLMKKLRM
jgi:acyl-CoA reductase-like NAD-dependent aldehyde dehydrogenase